MAKWKKGIQTPNRTIIPEVYQLSLPKTLTGCNSNGKQAKKVLKNKCSFDIFELFRFCS